MKNFFVKACVKRLIDTSLKGFQPTILWTIEFEYRKQPSLYAFFSISWPTLKRWNWKTLWVNNIPPTDTCPVRMWCSMFADNTTIFNAKKNVSFTMQPELDLISDWMISNKLTINLDKGEVMCFGSGNPPPLKIKDTPIQCKISSKYLGLHVDKWFRFNQHIEYLVKKTEQILWTNL